MEFTSVEEALGVIGEAAVNSHVREEARQFLYKMAPEEKIPYLVEALRDDNFKVQWEAAKMLSEMGRPALVGILYALADPKKVGDPRLRNGAYHFLRDQQDPFVRQMTARLVDDLHGFAADLRTMSEASSILQQVAGD